jgi:hypothetical protein
LGRGSREEKYFLERNFKENKKISRVEHFFKIKIINS